MDVLDPSVADVGVERGKVDELGVGPKVAALEREFGQNARNVSHGL